MHHPCAQPGDFVGEHDGRQLAGVYQTRNCIFFNFLVGDGLGVRVCHAIFEALSHCIALHVL